MATNPTLPTMNEVEDINEEVKQLLVETVDPIINSLVSISPQQNEVIKDVSPAIKAVEHAANTHFYQVHNTTRYNGQFMDELNAAKGFQLEEAKWPPLVIDPSKASYLVGPKVYTKRADGGSNVAALDAYEVVSFNDAKSSVRLTAQTAINGGFTTSFTGFSDNLETGESTPHHFGEKQFRITTRNETVLKYKEAVRQSENLRTKAGLQKDGVIRDLNNGLPHPSFQGDNFYRNLPSGHKMKNSKPYEKAENNFIKGLYEQMLETRAAYSYGKALKADKDKGNDLDKTPLTLKDHDAQVKADIVNMLSTPKITDLSEVPHEQKLINLNRFTRRDSPEIKKLLVSDPDFKQIKQQVNESILSTNRNDLIRSYMSNTSESAATNVNYSNLNFDAKIFDPSSKVYEKFTDNDAIIQPKQVDFDLKNSNKFNTVIVAQGQLNFDIPERLLDSDFESLMSKSILPKTTNAFNGINPTTAIPILQSLYRQTIDDRNDLESDGKRNDAAANQTIFLLDKNEHDIVSSFPAATEHLAKLNVAFIKPDNNENVWGRYIDNASPEQARIYLKDQLNDFNTYRSSIQDDNAPKPVKTNIDEILEATISDHILSSQQEHQTKAERDNRIMSLESKVEEFQKNIEATKTVLQNPKVKATLTSMMAFSNNEITDNPLRNAYNSLNTEYTATTKTDKNLNMVLIGMVGKIAVDSYMKQHNPAYVENAADNRYQNEKNAAVNRMVGYIASSDDNTIDRKELYASKAAHVVTAFMDRFPDYDQKTNERILRDIETAALDLRNSQLQQERVADGLDPAFSSGSGAAFDSKASLDVLGPDMVEIKTSNVKSSKIADMFMPDDLMNSLYSKLDDPKPTYEPQKIPHIELAVGAILQNPEFQNIKKAVLNDENYSLKGEDLTKIIPELSYFKHTNDPEEVSKYTSQDIKSIGSSQPDSAANEMNLVYAFVREQDRKLANPKSDFATQFKDMKVVPMRAADYPSADVMLVDLLVQKLPDINNDFNFKLQTLGTRSETPNPTISQMFNKELRTHLSGFTNDVFEHTAPDLLRLKLDDSHPSKQENIQALETTLSNESVGAEPASLKNAVNDRDDVYLAQTVALNPVYRDFMAEALNGQIEASKLDFKGSYPLEGTAMPLKDTFKKTFAAIDLIDTSNLPSASDKSMVNQLELSAKLHQRHGTFKSFNMQLSEHKSLDQAVIATMADNSDYFDKQKAIRIAVGDVKVGTDNPEHQAIVDTLKERGFSVAHPDMFKMNAAEFADKHFPDMVNSHEFEQFRDVPRETVANQTALEVVVSDDRGFERNYKLSNFNDSNELLKKQESDYAGRNNIEVIGFRCHKYADEVVKTIAANSKEPLQAMPSTLPDALWAKDTNAYLKSDLIVPGALSQQEIRDVSDKADASYSKLHLETPKAAVQPANNMSENTQSSPAEDLEQQNKQEVDLTMAPTF